MALFRHAYNRVNSDTQQQPSPIFEDSTAYRSDGFLHPGARGVKPRTSSNDEYELSEAQRGPNVPKNPIVELPRALPSRRKVWGWFYETWSILVAAGCFGGMVALLIVIDDKPLPKWPSEITVNTILSILVTIMKGALALTVTECLSQLKWSWFRQERRLVDLILLDEASRGAWGAFRLLFSIRGWYLAYFGAVMLLVAAIMGPTVQQTVEVRVRLIEAIGENATMPVCNASDFAMMGLGSGPGNNKVNLPVMGAMYDGLMQTSAQTPLLPGCPSGNCTYPRYQSLGFSINCEDKTSDLVYYRRGLNFTSEETNSTSDEIPYQAPYNSTLTRRECAEQVPSCEIEWPGPGLKLIPYGTVNTTFDYLTATDIPDLPKDDPPFYTFRGVFGPGDTVSNATTPEPVAVSCDMRFAVYTYEASMSGGNLSETIVSVSSAGAALNGTQFWDYSNYLLLPANPCYFEGKEVPATDDHCTYQIYSAEGLAIANTLNGILEGSGSRIVSNRPSFTTDILQAVVGLSDGGSLYDPKVGSFEYVNRAFQSLASTLTNHARGSKAVCSGATVLGTQWTDEVYLRVRWAWLAPTAVLFVLCVMFFIAVMIKFRGEDLWKSSPLAFLVARVSVDGRELSAEELRKLGGADRGADRRSIEKAAKEVSVSLGPVR